MSLLNIGENGEVNPPPPLENQTFIKKKVRDARGQLVTDKGANQAFIAYREYAVKKEAEDKAKAEKKARRAAKIAKGEALGPEDELDPEPSAILALGKILLFFIAVGMLLGWFITGSATWQYDGKWVQLRTYFDPSNKKLLDEYELSLFDGSTPGKPIYVAIDGDVYDVTEGAHAYGVGGKYHNFAGVDAARAFATACLKGDRTHDVRGLTERQLKSLNKWKKYFANKPKYPRVGRVLHSPIEPGSRLPPPCGEEQKMSPLPESESRSEEPKAPVREDL